MVGDLAGGPAAGAELGARAGVETVCTELVASWSARAPSGTRAAAVSSAPERAPRSTVWSRAVGSLRAWRSSPCIDSWV